MSWPSRTLGLLYSRLYAQHRTNAFSLNEAMRLVATRAAAKVYLHRLRRAGWAPAFPPLGRGTYRLQPPNVCMLLSSGRIRGLSRLKQEQYACMVSQYAAEAIKEVYSLRSLVLYGSVARGRARKDSDVDFLAVLADGADPSKTFDQLIDIELRPPVADELIYLTRHDISTHISVLPLTQRKLAEHPFILLDIVEDGIPVYDDGMFRQEAEKIRRRLSQLQAERIFLAEEDWYWDLIPQYPKVKVVGI